MNKLILTCEHGGAKIPPAYQKLFKSHPAVLKTHRALDIGALAVAQDLKSFLQVPLEFSITSRLVVDLNRFLTSRTLFSEFMGPLNKAEKLAVIAKYYRPHWNQVTKRIQSLVSKRHRVVHVAVHSMTGNLHGKNRPMHLALLYDPKHKAERHFANLWIAELRNRFPDFKIARNNPYKGDGEGLTTFFRQKFTETAYVGIELEMNQRFLNSLKTPRQRKEFSESLAASLGLALKKFGPDLPATR
jgi:predicted N-formylglutamate amidohydrolase